MRELQENERLTNLDCKFVVAYFTAPWCGPCRKMSPMVERFAKEAPPCVLVVKVLVNDCESECRRHEIDSIPCIKVFREKTCLQTLKGICDEATFCDLVAQCTD